MKCTVIFLLALFGGAHLLSCQDRRPVPDSLFSRIDRLAHEAVKESGFLSLAIGVVRGGKTIYAKGFGYADMAEKVPADAKTVYQLGSVTKTFTGHLLARFVAAGQLSLDDPVSDYLPDTIPGLRDVAQQLVTIREVATHSAELPRYPDNLQRTDPDPIRGFPVDQLYAGLEMVQIDTLAGQRYRYSNFGDGVLGTVMENRSGKSLNELMHDYIFDALEMSQSSLVPTEDIAKRLAIPYLEVDPLTKTEPWDMGALSGAGNLFSSVEDVCRFMLHLLTPSAVNEIQQQPYLKINERWSYGLGCFNIDSESKNTDIIYHGGDIDGYASYLALYPEYGFGIIILTNYGEGRLFGSVAEEVAAAAYEILVQRK